MNSREFDIYNNGKLSIDNINSGIIIIEKMLEDIDIILGDYNINDDKKTYLKEKKNTIREFLNKYLEAFSEKRLRQEYMELINKVNLNSNEQTKLDILEKALRGVSKKYNILIPYYEQILKDSENGENNAAKFYNQFYEEISRCFDIEDEIHTNIVIPIWNEYLDTIDTKFTQGDEFAYLLHSSSRFVSLPGAENYQSEKKNEEDIEHKTAFISASLLTDKEMETGNSSVGVVLKIKRKTILTSSPSDCGTVENNEKNVTNIKVNKDGTCVSIGLPGYDIPLSKLGTPKKIERDAIQASINNTGEILNAGKWIIPIYTEVVIDKEDFDLDGIFLKTTGCDINLQDYIVAKQMEMYYDKKLRIVNQSIYREKNGLNPYTKEEIERFNEQIKFYYNEQNYKMFDENPVLYRNLIQSYYKEVVCDAEFKEDARLKVESVFIKLIEHLNEVIKVKKLTDSNEINLNEIMELNLDEKTFPQTKYIPENIWGICDITKKEIGKEFAMSIPKDLKDKVEKLLKVDVKKTREEK